MTEGKQTAVKERHKELAGRIFGLWAEAGRPGVPEWGIMSIAGEIARHEAPAVNQELKEALRFVRLEAETLLNNAMRRRGPIAWGETVLAIKVRAERALSEEETKA